jgi:hypothetical protein
LALALALLLALALAVALPSSSFGADSRNQRLLKGELNDFVGLFGV